MRPVALLLTLLSLGWGCPGGGEDLALPTQQDAFRQPERLVAALGLRPGARVADVGAGGGYLTLRLARAVGPGGRVVATDIDGAALRQLMRRARAAGLPQIEARRVARDAPGLEAGAYDLILLSQVDHLLPDRAAYLSALRGALRPGGRIAISNGERHRDALLPAVRAAGLVAEESRIGLPGQFLLLLSTP
jgi:2-polyprenyl-3-methyl-5-hydroxy-6-metoxy-1,4-benzoquinol methylase